MLGMWKKAQIREEKFYRKIEESIEDLNLYKLTLREIWNVFALNLKAMQNKKILEIGCGSGGIIHYIESNIRIGIDPLCRKYRDIYIKNKIKIPHIAGVGENLPFKNESFDIIISINVLDHTLRPRETIRETRRILKNAGVFLLQVDTFRDKPKIIRKNLSIIDKLHPYHFSEKEINEMVNPYFKIVKTITVKFTILRVISEFKRHHIISSIKTFISLFLGAKLSFFRFL